MSHLGNAPSVALKLALATLGFVGALGAMHAAGWTDGARAQALIAHNSRAPVDFAADNLELQSRADRVVVAGNVVVTQAGMRLTAQRLTVAYSDSGHVNVDRLDATGGVTVTKGTDRASGDAAIYDLNRGIITMIGNVRLTQNGNQLQGPRMVIDLNSGRAQVGGSAPGTSNSGGRVTGRFTVPDRN